MSKKITLLLACLMALSLSGCSLSLKTQDVATNDVGGVFASPSQGDAWKQVSYIANVKGAPDNFTYSDVSQLVGDPSDSNAVYLATIGDGLYYTYGVVNGWLRASGLPKDTVNDVAVSAKNKCVIYAAINNKLYKSVDCNRNWSEVYVDNDVEADVMSVAIDHLNDNNVYLGTSKGDVLKSLNAGGSWRAIQHLNDGVKKIVISPKDSRIVFIASVKNGLYRFNSFDTVNLDQLAEYKNKFDGTNWMDLNGELREFNLGFNFKGLIFSASDNVMYLASDKMLLKSSDNGESWTKIKLVTADKDTAINAIAVSAQNSGQLYYVTDTTFYRSSDGGVTWITKELPSVRSGSALWVDAKNSNLIYLGFKKIKKNSSF
jgi:photosystem II stability/assembly factor-like uncharacterized protein